MFSLIVLCIIRLLFCCQWFNLHLRGNRLFTERLLLQSSILCFLSLVYLFRISLPNAGSFFLKFLFFTFYWNQCLFVSCFSANKCSLPPSTHTTATPASLLIELVGLFKKKLLCLYVNLVPLFLHRFDSVFVAVRDLLFVFFFWVRRTFFDKVTDHKCASMRTPTLYQYFNLSIYLIYSHI